MEIRPCDAQMFINKSSENTKNNNDILRQNDLYQDLSEHFKKDTENDAKKTIKSNESQGETIDSNKKGNGQFSGKKKSKKEKTEEGKNEKDKESKYLFDASI